MTIHDLIAEFETVLDGITAVFLDSRDGFELLQRHIEESAENKSWDTPIYFGDGPSETVENIAHVTTIGNRIGRNASDGDNCVFVSNMTIVAIYGYWEDHYRSRIAEALSRKKYEITSDIFGDIRWLRDSIVHRRSYASKDVERCRVLKWFSEGQEIFLNERMFLQMNQEIRHYLNEFTKIAL